jgi:hypothetical protein
MQFFNIKYQLVSLVSLLRKIKIFEAIKPLKFAAIYAAAIAKLARRIRVKYEPVLHLKHES